MKLSQPVELQNNMLLYLTNIFTICVVMSVMLFGYKQPSAYVCYVLAFSSLFFLILGCKLLSDIASNFKTDLPWFAVNGYSTSRYLFATVNIIFMTSLPFLRQIFDFNSTKQLASIVTVMVFLSGLSIFIPMDDNIILLLIVAILYALSLIANLFDWKKCF